MISPQAQADDLAVVYRDHAGAVYGLARRMCGSALAEAVTQEVFLGQWGHPERFDPARGSLRSFLLMMTQRRAIDALRSEGAQRRPRAAHGAIAAGRASDSHQALVEQDRSAVIMRAMSGLTAPEREAIVAAYHGDRTYREVAQALGVPLGRSSRVSVPASSSFATPSAKPLSPG